MKFGADNTTLHADQCFDINRYLPAYRRFGQHTISSVSKNWQSLFQQLDPITITFESILSDCIADPSSVPLLISDASYLQTFSSDQLMAIFQCNSESVISLLNTVAKYNLDMACKLLQIDVELIECFDYNLQDLCYNFQEIAAVINSDLELSLKVEIHLTIAKNKLDLNHINTLSMATLCSFYPALAKLILNTPELRAKLDLNAIEELGQHHPVIAKLILDDCKFATMMFDNDKNRNGVGPHLQMVAQQASVSLNNDDLKTLLCTVMRSNEQPTFSGLAP